MINELKIRKWIFITFSMIWMMVIFLDYIDKHPIYWLAIVNFKYFTWVTTLILLSGIGSAYYARLSLFKRKKKPKLNGITIYVIFIGLLNFTAFCFNQYFHADLNFAHYWHLTLRSSYTLLGGLIVVISSYSLGHIIISRLLKNSAKGITKAMSCIGLGMYALSMLLFGIGALGLLMNSVVLVTLFLPIAINYRESIRLLKSWLWQSYKLPKTWTFWSYFILCFCLIFTTLNFFYTQAPFPLGFDARNYYVNISQLIAEENGLVTGFQPYAWSLIASVGYIGFFSPEVTLFLSTIGGILTCWGIYELSVKYLNIKSNYALISILTFLLTPAIINHWIIEFKVDLALLFIQMTILNILFYWIKQKKATPLLSERHDWHLLILISILMGLSLSIKVLSIFLVFGILLVYYFVDGDRWGMIGLASMGISLPILLKLDDISGVRNYIDHPDRAAYMFLGIGSLLMIYTIIRQIKTSNLALVKILVTTGIISMLTFSPWIIKNYTENPDASIVKLIMGQKPQANISIQGIINNYKKAE